MPKDFLPIEIAACTAEGLSRMSADPQSTKRKSPHLPAGTKGKAPSHLRLTDMPSQSGLNRRLGYLSPETAKHYRQRRDGAIVRATPKPETRKPKRPKVIAEPKAPRHAAEVRASRISEQQERYRQRFPNSRPFREKKSRKGLVNEPRATQARVRAEKVRKAALETIADWPKKEPLPRRLRRVARITGKGPGGKPYVSGSAGRG